MDMSEDRLKTEEGGIFSNKKINRLIDIYRDKMIDGLDIEIYLQRRDGWKLSCRGGRAHLRRGTASPPACQREPEKKL